MSTCTLNEALRHSHKSVFKSLLVCDLVMDLVGTESHRLLVFAVRAHSRSPGEFWSGIPLLLLLWPGILSQRTSQGHQGDRIIKRRRKVRRRKCAPSAVSSSTKAATRVNSPKTIVSPDMCVFFLLLRFFSVFLPCRLCRQSLIRLDNERRNGPEREHEHAHDQLYVLLSRGDSGDIDGDFTWECKTLVERLLDRKTVRRPTLRPGELRPTSGEGRGRWTAAITLSKVYFPDPTRRCRRRRRGFLRSSLSTGVLENKR